MFPDYIVAFEIYRFRIYETLQIPLFFYMALNKNNSLGQLAIML